MKTTFLFIAALLLILQLSIISAQKTDYKLEYIPQEGNGGKCLDGSAPSIYLKDTKSLTDGKKVLLYFRGGGIAHDLSEEKVLNKLKNRLTRESGSNKYYKKIQDFNGILSDDQLSNPYFYDYTVIIINYCDGTMFTGQKEQPIYYDGEEIWVRGQDSLNAILEYTKDKYKIAYADTVVVGGTSAGGVATFLWTDHIAKNLKNENPKVKVLGIADGGLFYDYPEFGSHELLYKEKLKHMYLTTTDENTPYFNQKCQEHYSEEPWKCLIAQYLIQFIETPILSINSSFDSWIIKNILGITCIRDNSGYDYEGCTALEIFYIEQFHKDFLQKMEELDQLYENINFILLSCINHDHLNKINFFEESPATTINPLSYLSGFFVESGKIDSQTIDQVHWTQNQSCNNMIQLLYDDYGYDYDPIEYDGGILLLFNVFALIFVLVSLI